MSPNDTIADIASRLRTDPTALDDLFAAPGKPGELALLAFLAEAARGLGRTFSDVESVLNGAPKQLRLRQGVNRRLGEGVCRIVPRGPVASRVYAIKSATFVNRGKTPAYLLIETFDESGASQGFSFVRLAPGDKYVTSHNHPGVVAIVLIIGGIVIVVLVVIPALVDATIYQLTQCALSKHIVIPDRCVGSCPGSLTCTARATAKGWIFTNDTACACV